MNPKLSPDTPIDPRPAMAKTPHHLQCLDAMATIVACKRRQEICREGQTANTWYWSARPYAVLSNRMDGARLSTCCSLAISSDSLRAPNTITQSRPRPPARSSPDIRAAASKLRPMPIRNWPVSFARSRLTGFRGCRISFSFSAVSPPRKKSAPLFWLWPIDCPTDNAIA
jgi:hypothetical protein